jgi:hypothetical protein
VYSIPCVSTKRPGEAREVPLPSLLQDIAIPAAPPSAAGIVTATPTPRQDLPRSVAALVPAPAGRLLPAPTGNPPLLAPAAEAPAAEPAAAMEVVVEPVARAVERIAETHGDITSIKRIEKLKPEAAAQSKQLPSQ